MTVPVQIREMDDKEYMEILHVENLQREDVHPLDEAVGYKELLEQGGYDVATLSARLGKCEPHVYQRLKLNDLIKEGQKLFLENRIGFGHAVILARLDKKQQKDILANHLFSYQNEAVPVRQLSEYVRHYLYLDLGNVPWALDDADLLKEVGACSSCPKRTGSNPSLFTDMQNNICTDRSCFEQKMQAHIEKQIESRPGLLRFSDYPTNHRKDGSVLTGATCRKIWGKEDKCDSAEEAICIDGSARAMWRRVGGDSKRALLKASGHDVPSESVDQFGDRLIEKANPVELGRMMVCSAIADELLVSSYQAGNPEAMLKLADMYGIDLKAIRDGLKSETKPGSKEHRNRRTPRLAA